MRSKWNKLYAIHTYTTYLYLYFILYLWFLRHYFPGREKCMLYCFKSVCLKKKGCVSRGGSYPGLQPYLILFVVVLVVVADAEKLSAGATSPTKPHDL